MPVKKIQSHGSPELYLHSQIAVDGDTLTIQGRCVKGGETYNIPQTTFSITPASDRTDVEMYLVRDENNRIYVLADELKRDGIDESYDFSSGPYTPIELLCYFSIPAKTKDFDKIEISVLDIDEYEEPLGRN